VRFDSGHRGYAHGLRRDSHCRANIFLQQMISSNAPLPIRTQLPEHASGLPGIGSCIADLHEPGPGGVLSNFADRLSQGGLRYRSSPDAAITSLSAWFEQSWGASFRRDWLVPVGLSAKTAAHLLRTAVSLAGWDGPTISTVPMYGGLTRAVSTGGDELRIPLHEGRQGMELRYLIPISELQASVTAKCCLVLCNPHNPVGLVMGEHLSELASLSCQSGSFVISDELHADLCRPGVHHLSWASAARDENWAVIHSFGKAFSMSGLKVCHVIVPDPRVRAHFRLQLAKLGVHPGGLICESVICAVAHNAGDWIQLIRERVANSVDRMVQGLQAAGVFTTRPEAGFLVWADLGPGPESAADRLWNTCAVRVLGGDRFGATHNGYVRFNASLSDEHLDELVRRTTSMIRARG
jgi:cystathionine beta-lyase